MTAGAEIDDAESIVADSEAGGRVNESSGIVWPAMSHRGHHPIKRRLIRSALRIYQPTAYRAHLVKRPPVPRLFVLLVGRVDRGPFYPADTPTSFKSLWSCDGARRIAEHGITFQRSKQYRHIIHR